MTTLDENVRATADSGDLIGAIRQTRMASGLGLKESKELVERHLADNPASRERFHAAARQRRRWSWPAIVFTLLLLLVVVAVVLRDKAS